MNRKSIAAGAAAVMIVGGVAWVSLGSATATSAHPAVHGWPGATAQASAAKTIASVKADAAKTDSQVLLVYAHQVGFAYIDVGATGFSTGDYFMFEEQLRYRHGGAVIGRDSVRCTFGPRTVVCDGTGIIFSKGKIIVYGASLADADVSLAVTGGTGVYKGVGGQLDVIALGGKNSQLAFEITR